MIRSVLLALSLCAPAQEPVASTPVLPLRERAALHDELLRQRLDEVVPRVMRRAGVDAWVVLGREYTEDPVLRTMLPATWLSARRRTILVFFDRGPEQGVERLAVARYAVGDLFPAAWDKQAEPDQWRRLAKLLEERAPKRIALDVSGDFALADGLSHAEFLALGRALPAHLRARLVFEPRVAIGWLETRTPAELELYPTLCRIAHELIAEGFSSAAVTPGVTTTADLEWWFRERILDRRLSTWFHPSVSLQRAAGGSADGDFSAHPDAAVIQRGDLLHVDFGITYLGLNTDTQQHAYVLRAGEEEPPADLVQGLAVGNRLQDLLTGCFEAGRTGNEILSCALAAARAVDIEATIYTHPLGDHGHAAGPTIGMWDQQDGVPGKGDYPLFPSTVFSIELNAAVPIEAWDGQVVRFMLEEDAAFDGESVRYLDGRQTELILVR